MFSIPLDGLMEQPTGQRLKKCTKDSKHPGTGAAGIVIQTWVLHDQPSRTLLNRKTNNNNNNNYYYYYINNYNYNNYNNYNNNNNNNYNNYYYNN